MNDYRLSDRRIIMKLSYEKPTVQLSGNNGNAHFVMGAVAKAILKAGATDQEVKEYREKSTSGDYDNLLRVAMEYADCN